MALWTDGFASSQPAVRSALNRTTKRPGKSPAATPPLGDTLRYATLSGRAYSH